jgi:hypothetical protein
MFFMLSQANIARLRAEQHGVQYATMRQIKMWTVVGDLSAMLFEDDPAAVAIQHVLVKKHIGEMADLQALMASGDADVHMTGAIEGLDDEVRHPRVVFSSTLYSTLVFDCPPPPP